MFKIYLDFSIPPTKPNVKINDDEYFLKKPKLFRNPKKLFRGLE